VVLVYTARANESEQVRREVERAVAHRKALVPFRIEDVRPTGAMEYFLGSTHWLDAFTAPREPHYRRLTESVMRVLRSGEPVAAAPPEDEPTEGNPRSETSPAVGRPARKRSVNVTANLGGMGCSASILLGLMVLAAGGLAVLWSQGGRYSASTATPGDPTGARTSVDPSAEGRRSSPKVDVRPRPLAPGPDRDLGLVPTPPGPVADLPPSPPGRPTDAPPTPPSPAPGSEWTPPPGPTVPPGPPTSVTDVPPLPSPPGPAADVPPLTPAPGTALERKRAAVGLAWDEFRKALQARVVIDPATGDVAGRAEWWLAWQAGWRSNWEARAEVADEETSAELDHLLSVWAERAWVGTYPDAGGVRTFTLLVGHAGNKPSATRPASYDS
jgi:hypothetical protein